MRATLSITDGLGWFRLKVVTKRFAFGIGPREELLLWGADLCDVYRKRRYGPNCCIFSGGGR